MQLQVLTAAVERADAARVLKEVRVGDQTRRENAAVRLASIIPLSLQPLLPTSKWLGDVVNGATPINTSTRRFSTQAVRDGLHVMELFGGIGLGALRMALAAGYTVRCYTYVDKDPISRKIASAVLLSLQSQYPKQLLDAAINGFDKRLPQNIAQCSELFLSQLTTLNGPVDLLGGSWECQSVSRAGRQRGAMDPRFRYFYDLVRVVKFYQRDQATPLLYVLENTYPGEQITAAVMKASNLVQAFIGAPVLVDSADLGSAAHRVRLFWSNILQPAILQAVLPTKISPFPSLASILHPFHIPTKPGHANRAPFALQNQLGGGRMCMPTVVSYLLSNAYRQKESGAPGEGQVYNTISRIWEEPDADEKEQLLGYTPGDTATLGVSDEDRAIRLGRALDGNTMRSLGAILHAS